MILDKEEYLLTTLKSVLEVLVLIQDDTTKEHSVCYNIGDALNLPILALIECIDVIPNK